MHHLRLINPVEEVSDMTTKLSFETASRDRGLAK